MLISKTDVKLFLGITTNTDDALFDRLIACAEADAAVQIGTNISTVSTYTEIFDGVEGVSSLVLKYGPVSAITAVYDDIGRVFGSDTLLDASLYAVSASGVLKLVPGMMFFKGIQNIKVVYSAGYAAIPEDFKKALIYFVMADYMGIKTRINAVADDEVSGKISSLRKQAKEILERYKVVGHGD